MAVTACASVAPTRSSRLEIAHSRGFTMRAEIVESGGAVVVRGAVCRGAFTPPPPRYVRLE
ncbi:MAG TPA: hypothetical protein DHW63_07245, partial [Hyphomonadaceae bacterium]|nr:hypothetical protein [Hyphomonadaceae bacterium]